MMLTVCANPTEAERAAILGPLGEFNSANGYPADPQPVAILLHDAAGTIVGGLWGRAVYDWLFVEFIVVPAHLRGQDVGTTLMQTAERIASNRGCVGAWLTTFTFQAQGFYERLGYAVFGELEKSPRENVRIFLRKYFTAGDSMP